MLSSQTPGNAASVGPSQVVSLQQDCPSTVHDVSRQRNTHEALINLNDMLQVSAIIATKTSSLLLVVRQMPM